MKNRTALYLLLIIALNSFGQNGLKEFKKTMDAYRTIKQMSFDVEVYAYENKTSKKAELVGKGYAKKQNNLFFSKFAETEMLQHNGKTLMINHDSKQINFYDYNLDAAKASQMNLDMSAALDSVVNLGDSLFKYDGLSNNSKHFIKRSPGELIERTDYYTDANTNLITKVIYYYGEGNEDIEVPVTSVVIFFKNIKLGPTPESFFALDKFVVKKNNEYIGALNYKGYKVLYHKSKQKN